jgi:hypothetical protein
MLNAAAIRLFKAISQFAKHGPWMLSTKRSNVDICKDSACTYNARENVTIFVRKCGHTCKLRAGARKRAQQLR